MILDTDSEYKLSVNLKAKSNIPLSFPSSSHIFHSFKKKKMGKKLVALCHLNCVLFPYICPHTFIFSAVKLSLQKKKQTHISRTEGSAQDRDIF